MGQLQILVLAEVQVSCDLQFSGLLHNVELCNLMIIVISGYDERASQG